MKNVPIRPWFTACFRLPILLSILITLHQSTVSIPLSTTTATATVTIPKLLQQRRQWRFFSSTSKVSAIPKACSGNPCQGTCPNPCSPACPKPCPSANPDSNDSNDSNSSNDSNAVVVNRNGLPVWLWIVIAIISFLFLLLFLFLLFWIFRKLFRYLDQRRSQASSYRGGAGAGGGGRRKKRVARARKSSRYVSSHSSFSALIYGGDGRVSKNRKCRRPECRDGGGGGGARRCKKCNCRKTMGARRDRHKSRRDSSASRRSSRSHH